MNGVSTTSITSSTEKHLISKMCAPNFLCQRKTNIIMLPVFRFVLFNYEKLLNKCCYFNQRIWKAIFHKSAICWKSQIGVTVTQRNCWFTYANPLAISDKTGWNIFKQTVQHSEKKRQYWQWSNLHKGWHG